MSAVYNAEPISIIASPAENWDHRGDLGNESILFDGKDGSCWSCKCV